MEKSKHESKIVKCVICGSICLVFMTSSPFCEKCHAILPPDLPTQMRLPASTSYSPPYGVPVTGLSSTTGTAISASPSPSADS